MNHKILGIDFGTSSIKIVRAGHGVVLDEKSVIAIYKKTEVLAVGDEAYEMYEKAPVNINVSYPVKNGVIADLSNMNMMISEFLAKVSEGKVRLKGYDYYIAVPTDITEVEKRSYFDVIISTRLKPNHIRMVEKPIADALGMGLDILESTGVLMVDFGANTTEISILSLGGIIFSKLIPIGGNNLDEDIINLVKRKYNFVIGSKTAESIKKELGSAMNGTGDMVVFGRNTISGLPGELSIEASEVHDAIVEDLNAIMDNIKVILERTPPEVSADIYRNGLYLTGGSSKLHDISEFIANTTGLKVNVYDEPENTVINGLNNIIENPGYKKLVSDLMEG